MAGRVSLPARLHGTAGASLLVDGGTAATVCGEARQIARRRRPGGRPRARSGSAPIDAVQPPVS